MAIGTLFPAGIPVLIVVLFLVHEASSANDSQDHHCPPSSCGNIHNISYPFRLEGDPPICGDQRYTLSCENNQTVLSLYAGKYFVQKIDYTDYTIQVVDPDIHKDNNIPIIPRYFLNRYNFSSGDPYTLFYPDNIRVRFCNGDQYKPIRDGVYDSSLSNKGVVWVNCEKPVISDSYFDMSTCFRNGVNSSKSYRYVHVLYTQSLQDLGDLCQIEQMYPTVAYYEGSTCTDVYDQLVDGFKLSWVQVFCDNFTGDDFCYLNNVNFAVWCDPISLFSKVIGAVSNILVPQFIKKILFGLSVEDEVYLGKVSI